MTPKEIFDKRYLYYRDILNKPAIPLEARQLIFDAMEEYHKIKVKDNVVLDDVIKCKNLDEDFSKALDVYAKKTRKNKPSKKF